MKQKNLNVSSFTMETNITEFRCQLLVKVGRYGKTCRNSILDHFFTFLITDDFEILQLKIDMYMTNNLQKLNESPGKKFVYTRNDSNIYCRPGSSSKQSDYKLLSRDNYVRTLRKVHMNCINKQKLHVNKTNETELFVCQLIV